MKRLAAILTVLVLAALASVTLAKKGGGKPGGGDPPDYSVAYIPGTAGGNLYVMNADGSAKKRLTRFGVAHFAWHADGDKLLVHCQDLSPAGIYTIDFDGNASLVLPVDTLGFRGVAMSNVATPTGTRLITYVAPHDAGGPTLYVCEEDGSNPVPLLPPVPNRLLDGPTFHPSGGAIAVCAKPGPGEPKHAILVELGVDSHGNPIATNVTQLTELAGTALDGVGVFGPAFSNSGGTLAVAGGNASTPRALWFVDMDDLTNITNVTTCETVGAWNASDTLFYFTTTSGRRSAIHTVDSSGNITDLGVGGHHVKCRMP